ncbi:phosphatase domain-containing protein [Bacteriovorax sp. PP10]|uniref:Phosphatase domain-containing protein n=1 Tax=Bacteriovorax antarcticus TaxID=3088717 RepID=A0ABU5VYF3_9BACT|nr:phosphatase domain-containing protein [Bacteriovorax sp. PP10]MEA9358104.1 phosphatase domain-containing protein [Bacteriovorax sp. PP10]
MKKIILLLSLFSYSIAGLAKTIIVTDIDDTIKKANSMGGVGGLYHFLKKKPYEYTRDLFNEINAYEQIQGEETTFYYVSAAPAFTFDAPAWIKLNNFPEGPTYLKTAENGGETYAYKYRTIKAILEKELALDPDLKILFFGDNSQFDGKVYYDLKLEMKLSNSEIFIRDVSTEATVFDRDIPLVKLPGVYYFFSEMELVGNPHLLFISNKLIDGITKEYELKNLIPLYTLDTLAVRLKKICVDKHIVVTNLIVAACTVEGQLDANKYWREYYDRFKTSER